MKLKLTKQEWMGRDYDLIDAFKSIEECYDIPYPSLEEMHSSKWDTCPICYAKPRLWEFNNGRYAACKCVERYKDSRNVSAISIMEHLRKNNGSAWDYPSLELRDNWNKRCHDLDIVNRRNSMIDDITKGV